MSKEERIDYLEQERLKIWERLTYVEELVKKKTSDYELEAKLSSEQAAAFKESSEKVTVQILQAQSEIGSKLSLIRENYVTFDKLYQEIVSHSQIVASHNKLIQELYSSLDVQSKIAQNQTAEIQRLFDTKPQLEENLKKLESVFKSGDDYDSKLSTLFKSITDRKKEIDELYYEIVGFVEKDEDGNDTEIKGLKRELEESYAILKTGFADTEQKLANLIETQIKLFDDFASEKKIEFDGLTSSWKDDYSKVLLKIEALLPNALTTGLSYAYSEKKKNEEEENRTHLTSFRYAIWGLVLISFIPFSVSVYSLLKDDSLEIVIMRIPRIVLAILPLYLPVLWVAYSANRKMNLAKRLIEEYSHKEVLSKTFEGLSRQIDSIENRDVSGDLRIRLLYNILEVSSENPGKLISDYNKSDHPVMDALDKSVKLSNAVSKLSKIPGFAKLASALERKSNELLSEKDRKASAGLETIVGMEKRDGIVS